MARLLPFAAAAALAVGVPAVVPAQTGGSGPGASAATSGHEMQEHDGMAGQPATSGFGHDDRVGEDADDRTTGLGGRDRDDRLRNDRDDQLMDNDRRRSEEQ